MTMLDWSALPDAAHQRISEAAIAWHDARIAVRRGEAREGAATEALDRLLAVIVNVRTPRAVTCNRCGHARLP